MVEKLRFWPNRRRTGTEGQLGRCGCAMGGYAARMFVDRDLYYNTFGAAWNGYVPLPLHRLLGFFRCRPSGGVQKKRRQPPGYRLHVTQSDLNYEKILIFDKPESGKPRASRRAFPVP